MLTQEHLLTLRAIAYADINGIKSKAIARINALQLLFKNGESTSKLIDALEDIVSDETISDTNVVKALDLMNKINTGISPMQQDTVDVTNVREALCKEYTGLSYEEIEQVSK